MVFLTSALFVGVAHDVFAQAGTGSREDDELNSRAESLDAEDYKYMRPVCTQCHSPAMFLHARSWTSWKYVFNQMKGYGAGGTKEQWDHIYRYVQQSLTEIDINSADEDDLSAVLGVNESTAIEIVRRRSDKKFENLAELEAISGVNRDVIERVGPRILFRSRVDDE